MQITIWQRSTANITIEIKTTQIGTESSNPKATPRAVEAGGLRCSSSGIFESCIAKP